MDDDDDAFWNIQLKVGNTHDDDDEHVSKVLQLGWHVQVLYCGVIMVCLPSMSAVYIDLYSTFVSSLILS
jgi:hypothetical protein